MRIATRLTLLVVSLTLLVALTVSWFAVVMSSRAQYATLEGTINSVVDSGLGNPNAALSNALYVLQHDSYDLTLDVVSPSDQITQVNSGTVPLTRHPTLADVKNSLGHVQRESDLPGFLVRSLNVGGGDYLVVAASTAGVAKQNQHLTIVVVSAAVAIALIGIVFARQVMRRDLLSMARLIAYAGDVSKGGDVGPVPLIKGSRDLQELRGALTVMVNALRQRIELETQSAKIMQQFIDDASHELRTPLTVVKGYNDLMASGQLDSTQQQRAVTRVGREVERMESLVRDLLLLAQVREAPHQDEQLVDLSGLVRTKVLEFGVEHPGRRVSSEIHTGLMIRARSDFVERLLINAFNNVARHTPADAAVRVQLSATAGEGVLLIEDGGAGLPVYGVRPQRFQRFDDSRSRETGGSGLGMSIMADIAESLGGSMTTEPSSLGGLGVRFVLPLAK